MEMVINKTSQEMIIVGAIMVSAIIVFIGILKPLIFNRIPWKPLRKFVLSLSSIVFSFGATALYYVIESINIWDYYIHSSVAVSLLCIFTYWLYENFTCLRDLIDKIGKMAIKKIFKVASVLYEDKDIKYEIEKAKNELKAETQNEIKKASKSLKKDKDLENL